MTKNKENRRLYLFSRRNRALIFSRTLFLLDTQQRRGGVERLERWRIFGERFQFGLLRAFYSCFQNSVPDCPSPTSNFQG